MKKTILNLRFWFFVFSSALFLLSASIRAERLPVRVFTSADGLATSVVHFVERDSQGFLWFCGRGGLSRFDGYEFTSYRLDEESAPLVHRILESRDGKYYWIATDTALYRAARPAVDNVQPASQVFKNGVRRLNAKRVSKNSFWALWETPDGRLLAGTSTGLYLIENKEADEITAKEIVFSKTALAEKRASVRDFAQAKDGSLWIATDAGIARMLPDNRLLVYDVPRDTSISIIAHSIVVDSAGRVWTSFNDGFFILQPEPIESLGDFPNPTTRLMPFEEQNIGIVGSIKLPAKPGEIIKLKFAEAEETAKTRAGQTAANWVLNFYQASDGKIRMPTQKSLYIFAGETYSRLRYPAAFPGAALQIRGDLQGNLWFGTMSGVFKYTRNGLTSYNETSSLPEPTVHSIQETPDGRILVAHGRWRHDD